MFLKQQPPHHPRRHPCDCSGFGRLDKLHAGVARLLGAPQLYDHGSVAYPPTGGDRGNVAGRQYTGELIGPTLTVSGKAVSDNPSSGPGSMDDYEIVVSVVAGKEKKEYGYIAQKGEKLNKSFSLSVPVTPGASGSFSISLLEQNANYGPHGWVVGGSLAASKGGANTNTQPVAASQEPGRAVTAVNTRSSNREHRSVGRLHRQTEARRGRTHLSAPFRAYNIVGRFEDHASGQIRNRGELTLRIVSGSKLEYVSSSVPFGGLNLEPMKVIIGAFD